MKKQTGRKKYLAHKETARALVLERIEHWRKIYAVDNTARGYTFNVGCVSIRNQRTRWGSCSAKGNITLNWKLLMAPPDIVDYVIIHELAHRKHMNHSQKFWQFVELYSPRWKEYRKWLVKHEDELKSSSEFGL